MKIGMLWFDNDQKKTIEEKVAVAVKFYEDKYKIKPDVCFVNPSMIDKSIGVNGISVRPNHKVLPGHFWIGTQED
jgi:hypothetical protein